MQMANATLGVSVPADEAQEIEQHVDEHDYESLSAFLKQAARNQMQADMGEA